LAAASFPDVCLSTLFEIIHDLSTEILVVLVIAVVFLYRKYPILGAEDTWGARPGRKWEIIAWIYVGLLIVAAISLRMIHLSILDPYTDENAHIRFAQKLIEGGSIPNSRAPLVSYLVYWFWKIGGPEYFAKYVYWSRVPGVIFGSLTGVPIYLIAKRVSQSVAVTACLLWTVCPWAIGVSRYAREYAYYPLFVLFLLWSFLKLADLYKSKCLVNHKVTAAAHILYILGLIGYSTAVDYPTENRPEMWTKRSILCGTKWNVAFTASRDVEALPLAMRRPRVT
jgi:hypothetical protein